MNVLSVMRRRAGMIVCLALVALLAGSLTSRFLRLSPPARMHTFPDDSFYYMVPALNIARGLGPTADTVTRTSGFHPLWMAILAGIAWLCGCDKLAYFDLVIVAGMTLHAVTALLLYLAATRFVPAVHAVALSVIFLTVERGFLDALGGIEAALVTAVLAALLWLDTTPSLSSMRLIARGVSLGLLFLARTDSFIFIVVYLCVHAGFIRANERSGIAGVLRSLGPVTATMVLVCTPWFAITWHVYGALFQGSQITKQFWRSRMLAESSIGEALRFSFGMLRTWLANVGALYPERLLMVLSFLAGIGVVRLVEEPRSAREAGANTRVGSLPNLVAILAALVAYVVGAGVFYAMQFVETRRWYFAGGRMLWVVVAILLCAFAFETTRRTLPRRVLEIVTGVMLALVAISTARAAIRYSFDGSADSRGPGQFVRMAEYIDANLPKNAIIGAYSSGILSYFCERRVINLDGLANNDIVAIARARRMDAYLDAKGVTYLADHESIVRPGFNVGLHVDGDPRYIRRLRELHRLPESSVFGDIVLWEVTPRDDGDEGEKR